MIETTEKPATEPEKAATNEATRFKPVHDQIALRTAFIAFKATGGSNGEFAEKHGLGLRTLQGYLVTWKRDGWVAKDSKANEDDQSIGEDEGVSPLDSSDKRAAMKVYRAAMAGKPVTPTRLKAAQDVLKIGEGVVDDRSEFQQWPDEKLASLLHELAPKRPQDVVGGERPITPLIKHGLSTPLPIDTAPSAPEGAQALTPQPQATASPVTSTSESEATTPAPTMPLPALVDALPEINGDMGTTESAA